MKINKRKWKSTNAAQQLAKAKKKKDVARAACFALSRSRSTCVLYLVGHMLPGPVHLLLLAVARVRVVPQAGLILHKLNEFHIENGIILACHACTFCNTVSHTMHWPRTVRTAGNHKHSTSHTRTHTHAQAQAHSQAHARTHTHTHTDFARAQPVSKNKNKTIAFVFFLLFVSFCSVCVFFFVCVLAYGTATTCRNESAEKTETETARKS